MPNDREWNEDLGAKQGYLPPSPPPPSLRSWTEPILGAQPLKCSLSSLPTPSCFRTLGLPIPFSACIFPFVFFPCFGILCFFTGPVLFAETAWNRSFCKHHKIVISVVRTRCKWESGLLVGCLLLLPNNWYILYYPLFFYKVSIQGFMDWLNNKTTILELVIMYVH